MAPAAHVVDVVARRLRLHLLSLVMRKIASTISGLPIKKQRYRKWNERYCLLFRLSHPATSVRDCKSLRRSSETAPSYSLGTDAKTCSGKSSILAFLRMTMNVIPASICSPDL